MNERCEGLVFVGGFLVGMWGVSIAFALLVVAHCGPSNPVWPFGVGLGCFLVGHAVALHVLGRMMPGGGRERGRGLCSPVDRRATLRGPSLNMGGGRVG